MVESHGQYQDKKMSEHFSEVFIATYCKALEQALYICRC